MRLVKLHLLPFVCVCICMLRTKASADSAEKPSSHEKAREEGSRSRHVSYLGFRVYMRPHWQGEIGQ